MSVGRLSVVCVCVRVLCVRDVLAIASQSCRTRRIGDRKRPRSGFLKEKITKQQIKFIDEFFEEFEKIRVVQQEESTFETHPPQLGLCCARAPMPAGMV